MKVIGKRVAGLDLNFLKRFLPYLKKSTWLAIFSFGLMIAANPWIFLKNCYRFPRIILTALRWAKPSPI
jgi:hypothetical protein